MEREQAGGRVRVSPRKGSGASMLLVAEAGKWRRLHAKERMAAADMWAAHLEIQAWRAACRSRTGRDWVLLRAINRTTVAASWLHLPPLSKATTTRRARPPPTISGYVLLWPVGRCGVLLLMWCIGGDEAGLGM